MILKELLDFPSLHLVSHLNVAELTDLPSYWYQALNVFEQSHTIFPDPGWVLIGLWRNKQKTVQGIGVEEDGLSSFLHVFCLCRGTHFICPFSTITSANMGVKWNELARAWLLLSGWCMYEERKALIAKVCYGEHLPSFGSLTIKSPWVFMLCKYLGLQILTQKDPRYLLTVVVLPSNKVGPSTCYSSKSLDFWSVLLWSGHLALLYHCHLAWWNLFVHFWSTPFCLRVKCTHLRVANLNCQGEIGKTMAQLQKEADSAKWPWLDIECWGTNCCACCGSDKRDETV